jgi:hypothetical protein
MWTFASAVAVAVAALSAAATVRAEAPVDGPSDGGPADARVSPACVLRAEGAHLATVPCVLDQPYDHPPDAGLPPYVAMTEWPRATGRRIRVVVNFVHTPAVGLQPQRIFSGLARVADGTSVWEARVSDAPGSMGSFTVWLSTVRHFRDGGTAIFEVHGTAEAQLIPTVEGTAVGTVTLHASF